ncbi:hypothetical protein [Modestobacter sp. I12A-02662]|uniref:hypothetical protein n=1 Tax=Modestobacter sp. I12A-02662 TaxID=1730496 RepID=UPI0034DDE80E
MTRMTQGQWNAQASDIDLRFGLRDVVSRYGGLVEHYRTGLYPSMRPEKYSRAYQERDSLDDALADEWSSQPLSLAYGTAEMHMGSAQDHLGAVAIALGSNLQDSIMTLARGVVEGCARAAWLLETNIDGRARIARCITERLDALREQAGRIERLQMQGGPDTFERIAAIERSAIRQGVEVIRDKKGNAVAVGWDRFPRATQAVELLYDRLGPNYGRGIYADLSAVAHGTLAAFAYKKLPLLDPREAPIQAPPPEDRIPFERGVVMALTAYDEAVRRYFTLFGWALGPWHDFLTRAHARLRALLGVEPSRLDIVRIRGDD